MISTPACGQEVSDANPSGRKVLSDYNFILHKIILYVKLTQFPEPYYIQAHTY